MRIENKTLESDDFSTIESEEVEFFNCTFKLSSFNIRASRVIFKECKFLCGTYISNSDINFSNCIFSNIEGYAVNIENSSSCEISNCDFSQNGSYDVLSAQILLMDSVLNLKSSRIEKGLNSNGIEAANSKINIKDTILSKNAGCGILMHGCIYNIESLKVAESGREDEDFTQVYLDSSKGELINCEICDGVNSSGVVVTNQSELFLKKSVICRHKKNGLSIERYSVLNMDSCDIYENGDEFEETLQIWLDNSKLTAKSCSIRLGVCGLYAQKGGYVNILDCDISDNIGGLCIFESSEVVVGDSHIANNKLKPQLWLEGSKATILKSDIKGTDCCEAIHAEDMQLLRIENSHIKDNNMIIKNCRNVEIKKV